MKLTKHEEELLALYRADKRKKRKMAFITFVVFLFLSSGSIFAYKQQDLWLPYLESLFSKETDIPDIIQPRIILKQQEIEVEEGHKIDYLDFVSSAYDNIDGDLTDKITYEKIDTNVLGEHKIFYEVIDKAGNRKTACIDVLVKAKPVIENEQEVEERIPEIEESNESSSSINEVIDTPTEEEPDEEEPPIQSEIPAVRYFLFSDGYTMDNVANACGNALKASGRSGICSPIQDSDGVYLGMRLDFD